MKTRTTIAALALLLAAGVSHAALAQDSTDNRSHRSRGEHQGGGPRQGLEQRGRHTTPPAVATQAARAQAQAPAQAPAQAQAPSGEGFRGGQSSPDRRQVQAPRGEGFRGGQSSPDRRQVQAPRSDGVRAQAQGRDRGRHDGDSRFGGLPRSDGRWDRRGDRDHFRWERGRFPPVYQSDRRFRISPYRYPQGYFARSWGFGDFLPRGWFGPDYLLGDFYAYGLPYPPPGYEWVRVGPDALMVDRYTGRVVQVVRYVFW